MLGSNGSGLEERTVEKYSVLLLLLPHGTALENAMAAIPCDSRLLVEAWQPGGEALPPKPGPRPMYWVRCTWQAQAWNTIWFSLLPFSHAISWLSLLLRIMAKGDPVAILLTLKTLTDNLIFRYGKSPNYVPKYLGKINFLKKLCLI